MPPSNPAALTAAPKRRFSSGALPLLLLAAFLAASGAAAIWYERGIEEEARVLAEEIASSVVPDEALVASKVKGARAANEILAAGLSSRFAPRAEPVAALRVIEAAAKKTGVTSSFTRVEVLGWSGQVADFGDFGTEAATSTPYAAIVTSIEATGSWAQALAFAAELERLPLVSRVDALRLSAAVSEEGAALWAVSAELAVAAK